MIQVKSVLEKEKCNSNGEINVINKSIVKRIPDKLPFEKFNFINKDREFSLFWDTFFTTTVIILTFTAFYHNFTNVYFTSYPSSVTVSQFTQNLVKTHPIFLLVLIPLARWENFVNWLRYRPFFAMWIGVVIGHIFWPVG